MNWHKTNAIKTNNTNRKMAAHVVDNSRDGFYAVCGQHLPRVTISSKYAGIEPTTCKKCLSKLIK